MALENKRNSTQLPPQDKKKGELLPNAKLNVKPKSPTTSGLEIPVEQLEEQATVDDPVRMYLHEIGRVRLLTADNEKVLAKKLEEGKRINEIRQDYLKEYGKSPSATEIILIMLRDLEQATTIIHLLQKQLELAPADSFIETISNTTLRGSINNEINQQIVQAIATQMDKSLPETEQLLINLSINMNLLPEEILDAIGDSVSLADIVNLVVNDTFIDSVQVHENQLKIYQQHIEQEAEKAKRHLTKANLCHLVDSSGDYPGYS